MHPAQSSLGGAETEEGLVQNSHQRRGPEDGFEMKMADSLLQEQLARLRGSWRHQQSRAANEASTAGGRATAAPSLSGTRLPQWLAGQAEARATDGKHRRDQQLLRQHYSYQQQLRELAHGSPHQQRYYPPALPPAPSTPAPLMRATSLLGPPKRPSPYQAPGEPLEKRPCLVNPNLHPNLLSSRREQWELLVELGRRQTSFQLEQINHAERHNQMHWLCLSELNQMHPLGVGESFKQLVRTPVGKLALPGAPPTMSMLPPTAPGGSTLKERFVRHVMCHYTPLRPSEIQMTLWVSCGHLINLLQPHAPTEVLQLGPKRLTQLITEWYKDHPAYAGLPYSSWCKNLRDKSKPHADHRSRLTIVHFPFHDRYAAKLIASTMKLS